MNLVPPSGGARKIIRDNSAHRSLNVPRLSVVDFYVPRSAEEQEMETPHPTGESGLTAEEE